MAGLAELEVMLAQAQQEQQGFRGLFGVRGRRADGQAAAAQQAIANIEQREQAERQQQAQAQALGASKVVRAQGGVTDDPGAAYQMGQDAIDMAAGGYDPAAVFAPQTAAGRAQFAREQQQQGFENSLKMQDASIRANQIAREQAKEQRQNFVGLRQAGRQVAQVDDLMTVMAEEGRLIAPDQAKQFYQSGRAKLLLNMKNLYELGVLSEQDVVLLDDLLGPKADTIWTTGTQSQRMEAMRLIRGTYRDALEDKALLYDSPFGVESFIGERRSAQDILTPLFPGGEYINSEDLRDSKEIPLSPSGSLSPFNMFLQQIGF